MNVLGHRERSWRKARKRAVSPIIATILLVAITVVLAAVLYVLISGLTHGPGSTPIGSAFSAGNPVASTCPTGYTYAGATGVTTHGCKATDQIYTLTIETSTVTMGSVQFEVKTATGSIYAVGANGGGFSVMTIGGVVAAQSTAIASGGGLAMSATFSYYDAGAATCNSGTCTSSTPLTNIYTIVVDLGVTTSVSGQGLTFNAIGVGSYSGTTAPVTLP
jgi:flagellin-like protein